IVAVRFRDRPDHRIVELGIDVQYRAIQRLERIVIAALHADRRTTGKPGTESKRNGPCSCAAQPCKRRAEEEDNRRVDPLLPQFLEAVSLACMVIAAAGCIHALGAAWLVRRWRLRPRSTTHAPTEPVTVLKPLHGVEPGLQENL